MMMLRSSQICNHFPRFTDTTGPAFILRPLAARLCLQLGRAAQLPHLFSPRRESMLSVKSLFLEQLRGPLRVCMLHLHRALRKWSQTGIRNRAAVLLIFSPDLLVTDC